MLNILRNSSGEISGKKLAGWLCLVQFFLIIDVVLVGALMDREISVDILHALLWPLNVLIGGFFTLKGIENFRMPTISKKSEKDVDSELAEREKKFEERQEERGEG